MKRLYESLLKQHFDKENKMAFLAGPRQVGKTTTALAVFDTGLYLNWDNQEHRSIILKGPREIFNLAGGAILDAKRTQVVFDEIHKYPAWKNFLKGFFDTYSKDIGICVTGSARLDVYKHGGDSLMGRYFLYRMHPLTIREIAAPQLLDSEYGAAPVSISEEQWTTLVRFGGFPEPFMRNEPRFYNRWKKLRLEALFNEDLRDLTHITDIGRMKILAARVAASCGGMLNYAHLANDIQVSVDTIRRWLDILESVYYSFRIRPYSHNVARSLLREPKVYLWDWTMAPDVGSRNENIVAAHLLKHVHYLTDMGFGDYGLWYLRDKNKREVDFLVTKDNNPWILVEAKTGGTTCSPHLSYFKEATKAPYAFQVSFSLGFVAEDCFSRKDPVIVPARTFLSQLV